MEQYGYCAPDLHDGKEVPGRFRVRNAGRLRKDGSVNIGHTNFVCCEDHVGYAVEWVNTHSNSVYRESNRRYNRAVVTYIDKEED